jgi:hypothetical protein
MHYQSHSCTFMTICVVGRRTFSVTTQFSGNYSSPVLAFLLDNEVRQEAHQPWWAQEGGGKDTGQYFGNL